MCVLYVGLYVVDWCLLIVVCWWLFVVRSVLGVVCCMWFVVCSLHVVCCLFVVVCFVVLFVVCGRCIERYDCCLCVVLVDWCFFVCRLLRVGCHCFLWRRHMSICCYVFVVRCVVCHVVC